VVLGIHSIENDGNMREKLGDDVEGAYRGHVLAIVGGIGWEISTYPTPCRE